jgi:hypothetical protein
MQFYDRLNVLLIRFVGRLVAFIGFDDGHFWVTFYAFYVAYTMNTV